MKKNDATINARDFTMKNDGFHHQKYGRTKAMEFPCLLFFLYEVTGRTHNILEISPKNILEIWTHTYIYMYITISKFWS